MNLILDSGGVSALAGNLARLRELRRRGQWPPVVPTAVLAETLTGDHRRDFHTNRFLHRCTIRPLTEVIARHAASLRHLSSAADASAADAIVVATADHGGGGVVLTGDLKDIGALARNTVHPVTAVASD